MDAKQQAIASFIAASSHTQAATTKLEEYLLESCRGQDAPYCGFDVIRSLVKLYLLYPAKSSAKNLSYACFLVLQHDDTNDQLLALKYMIGNHPSNLQYEPLQTVLQAYDHLTACRFADFWKAMAALQASSDTTLQSMAKNATVRLQERILAIFALTYKEAPAQLVLSAIQSKNLPNQQTFAKLEGDKVVFAATAENTKTKLVFKEGLNFDAVYSLMSKIAQ
jgi:hypothetical protein